MFIDLSKYFECECVEKYLTYYELALFLKHSPVEDVKELYYFAINHSLLDEEVDVVAREYNEESSKVIKPTKSLNLNKVEYTFEDVIALFSN